MPPPASFRTFSEEAEQLTVVDRLAKQLLAERHAAAAYFQRGGNV